MNTRPALLVVAATLLLAVGGCRAEQQVSLPVGDPAAGEATVAAMRCYVCHEMIGSKFPPAHAHVPGITLGATQARWTRDSLAAAILAPSHERPEGQMGDYSEVMTVRQLIDIVAYLQTLGQ
jgi:cytochrome c2